jgi:hypothetical protein
MQGSHGGLRQPIVAGFRPQMQGSHGGLRQPIVAGFSPAGEKPAT